MDPIRVRKIFDYFLSIEIDRYIVITIISDVAMIIHQYCEETSHEKFGSNLLLLAVPKKNTPGINQGAARAYAVAPN